MKRVKYYVKLFFLMILMSMAAFGLVMPGQMNTRKRHKDKEITIEWVTSIQEEQIEEVQNLDSE